MPSRIYSNVSLGEGTHVDWPCVIGKPPRGSVEGELATRIGRGGLIRPFTTIYAGVVIGDDFQGGQGACIREDNVLGDSVSVGTNAVFECGNRVGDRTRIHTGCFLELVTLGDDVFVGPNVVFTDDLHPPCARYRSCVGGAVVGNGVRIGANSTIVPGIHIGDRALIAAGSVVTRDVEPDSVVAGNPARLIGKVDELKCRAGLYERPYGAAIERQATEAKGEVVAR